MKIYASDLVDITQVLTGDILHIADAHTTAGVATTGGSAAEGLIIATGDDDKFLNGTGQEVVITNTTVGRMPVAVQSADGTKGTIPSGAATNTNAGGGFIDSSILQDNSGHITIRVGASDPANLTVTGDLIVLGTNTILESADTITEAKYLEVNTNINDTTGAVVTSGAITADGGVLVQRNAPIQQTSASSGTAGTHGGIRFKEDTQANGGGRWQTTVATTNDGGADGDWVNIGSGSGTVDKYAQTCELAANGTIIAVVPGSTEAGGTSPVHTLSGSDFSVKVFEVGTFTYEEIIPEAIYNVHAAGTVEGAARTVGTVVIKFPVLNTTQVTNIRVVIKG